MYCGERVNQYHKRFIASVYIKYVLIAQLCLTLCNPMDCSPPVGKVNMMEVLVYFFSQSVIGIL